MEIISYVIFEKIDYLAVLLAALANFAFGALWYSPLMFSKKWAAIVFKGQSFEEATSGSNMALIFSIAFLAGLFQAFGLAVFLFSGASLLTGGLFGGFIALFFIFFNHLKNSQFERRPFSYVLINGGHDFIVFFLIGMIIAPMHL